jgi:hypothetical protein
VTAPDRRAAWSRLAAWLAPIMLLGAMVLFAHRGVAEDSPTEDEWAHLTRGVAWWSAPDTRLSFAHPPLANALCGLPTALAKPPKLDQFPGWKRENLGEVATNWLRRDYAGAKEALHRGRLVMIGLAAAFGLYLYGLARRLFGAATGYLTLALYCFHPMLVAHTRYVTTDFPSAVAYSLVVGELIVFVTDARSKWRLGTLSLAVAAALLTKHSALFLGPILFVVLTVAALFGLGRYAGHRLAVRLSRLVGALACIGTASLLGVNAGYKFQRTGTTVATILAAPEPQYGAAAGHRGKLLETKLPILTKLPPKLRIPLPHTYVLGIAYVRALNDGGFSSYFWGKRVREGEPLYFPALLALKSPPALLVPLGLGLSIVFARAVRALRRRGGPIVSGASGIAFAYCALFLAAAMSSRLNMGFRHILPIAPMLVLLAARSAATVGDALASLPSLARLGPTPLRLAWGGALGLGSLVSMATAPAAYLGYFNAFALGRGAFVNVYGEDWGQDRGRLADLVRREKLEPLYYDTQTTTRKLEWESYRIPYEPMTCKTVPRPGSWVAIHALPFKTRPESCFSAVRKLEPTFNLLDHVYVWKIPE